MGYCAAATSAEPDAACTGCARAVRRRVPCISVPRKCGGAATRNGRYLAPCTNENLAVLHCRDHHGSICNLRPKSEHTTKNYGSICNLIYAWRSAGSALEDKDKVLWCCGGRRGMSSAGSDLERQTEDEEDEYRIGGGNLRAHFRDAIPLLGFLVHRPRSQPLAQRPHKAVPCHGTATPRLTTRTRHDSTGGCLRPFLCTICTSI